MEGQKEDLEHERYVHYILWGIFPSVYICQIIKLCSLNIFSYFSLVSDMPLRSYKSDT